MVYGGSTFDVLFDLASHRLVIATSDSRVEQFALRPMAVADFYAEFMQRLRRLASRFISDHPVKSRTPSHLIRTISMPNTTANTSRSSIEYWCSQRA